MSLVQIPTYLLLVPIAVPSEVQNAAAGQVHEEILPIGNLGKERDLSSRLCQGPVNQQATQQPTHVTNNSLHERMGITKNSFAAAQPTAGCTPEIEESETCRYLRSN